MTNRSKFLLAAIVLAVRLLATSGGFAVADEPAAVEPRLVSNDWPGVYSYHDPARDTCHVAILKDGEAALLVNLGAGEVLGRLEAIGVKRVEWLLLTDHHREQCQGIERLDRAVAKVAAPKAAHTVHGASYVRPPHRPIPLDRVLEDGETFRWRGFELTCLATPGHSPGGMTYLLRRDGRTLTFVGGVAHDGARMANWFDTEWDYGFAKGLETLTASVDKLRLLRPELAMPTQGPVIRNATTQLDAYHAKLSAFHPDYVRGYPVNSLTKRTKPIPFLKPTAIPQIVQVTPHLYKFSDALAGKNFAIIISDNGRGLLLDCGIFPELLLHDLVKALDQSHAWRSFHPRIRAEETLRRQDLDARSHSRQSGEPTALRLLRFDHLLQPRV
jgi:glyoxylase-like metal-dependent hydrolase (beta-lactamase superfamily II)